MSEPAKANGLLTLVQSIKEEKAWAAEHPEIAADWDEAREESWQRSQAVFQRRVEDPGAFLLRCGVGELEVEILAGQLDDRLARRETARWLASGQLVLLLHGGTGSGKTIAAAEALLSLKDAGWDGMLVTADALARRSYFDIESHEADCRASLLVVDDIGTEQMSTTFQASLDGLLSERIRRRRRTVLTTNLDLQAFVARYSPPGSRLASRFSAHATIASSGTDDLRKARRPARKPHAPAAGDGGAP